MSAPANEKDLYFLTFVSAARHLLADEDLERLLTTCRRNNQRRKITGLLLYYEGSFLEVIEGSRPTVEWLFQERVSKDPRHSQVRRLLSGPLASRCFPDWSMGFKRVDRATVETGLPGFNAVIESRTAPEQAYAQVSGMLLTFLRSFYRSSGLAHDL